jgi:prophage regulatory protein
VTDTPNAGTPAPTSPAPIRLAGIDEILDLVVDISKERVLELTFRSDFPKPAEELGAGDVWLLDDVEAWLNRHGDVLAEVFTGE